MLKRTKLPTLALSAVLFLVFVTQFLLTNITNIKRIFNNPQFQFNSKLISLANVLKNEGPTVNYPNEWFSGNYSYIFDLKHVCPCKLRRRTKKDLIIVYANKSMAGATIFMQSLRRTGYFSPVVIMADEEAVKRTTNATQELLSIYDAFIIPIGSMSQANMDSSLFGIISIYDFLKSHTQYYDRVLICDLHGTVFQENPFNFPMQNNTLYFVSERIKFNNSDINKDYIINDYGKSFPKEWLENDVINGEQVMGDAAPMLVFLYRCIQHMKLKSMSSSSGISTNLQATFNVLIYSNELDVYNIPYVICKNETYSVVMSSEHFNVSAGFYNVTDHGSYIPMITQYYINSNFSKQILEEFPREDGNLTDYIKTFSDDETKRICDKIFEKKRQKEEERRRIEEEAFRKAEEKRLKAIALRRKRLEKLKANRIQANNQNIDFNQINKTVTK